MYNMHTHAMGTRTQYKTGIYIISAQAKFNIYETFKYNAMMLYVLFMHGYILSAG